MVSYDLFGDEIPRNRGYRLHRLEVYNWGTFDSAGPSCRGRVYKVEPKGETILLIGKNGSGKSTLVDSLLTLLVRPSVRNYNVAAGAKKRERDERTYIKGAFDRRSRGEDNLSSLQFLRPDGKQYSVLLACFRNEQTEKAFTVAQILYLLPDGRTEKVYCFAKDERSIAADCSKIKSMEKLQKQMRDRGFRASKSYAEYYEWFRKESGLRPKAMDMLNQTVAVKDIQRLNDFIRTHMLEAKPWGEKIDGLLLHFTQLCEAYQSLVRVRRQFELLHPIEACGIEYREEVVRLESTQRVVAAADSFFDQKIMDLFSPFEESRKKELSHLVQKKDQLTAEITQIRDECRRLTNQIEAAGGDRLREIPRLIQIEDARANGKRAEHSRFHRALESVGMKQRISDGEAFSIIRNQLPELLQEAETEIKKLSEQRDQLVIQRGEQTRSLRETKEELVALKRRRENLPRSFAEMRQSLCEELRLPIKDVPFAAELIAVSPEESEWESSIEMVLRSFALSLLVPQRHYQLVSSYIDRTRLKDHRGSGQRLVYLKINKRARMEGLAAHPDSLYRKLLFRDGFPLLPWIKAELEERFDYRCCEDTKAFQEYHGKALTRNRHVKSDNNIRHSKDDRDRVSDPKNFVLGWDNREKCRRLAELISQLEINVKLLEEQIQALDESLALQRTRTSAIREASSVTAFSEIDYLRHEMEMASLNLEKKQLEEEDDTIQLLKKSLAERRSKETALVSNHEQLLRDAGRLEKIIEDAAKIIANAQRRLERLMKEGLLTEQMKSFPLLENYFIDDPLSIENILDQGPAFKESQRQILESIRERIEPIKNNLLKGMNRFLREFPERQDNLDADTASLDSFLGLMESIREEGLPEHEQRFKERLNDKVTREIGLLNGELQRERSSIEDKIELLNVALSQVDYRPGTLMRLEAKMVRDVEINEFRGALAECLAGTFEGSLEADEARFLQIEKLIKRLREETRWRDKVTDVRRWFDFAAREIERETGDERSYYEDSSGQSGGEKAKLAFTILVAAITYQYEIDPNRPVSERFHFVVVDEMFSKVDDQYAEYALELFRKFGLQLLIVAPLDAKARVTEPYVGCYLLVTKGEDSRSEIHTMTAREFQEQVELIGNSDPTPLKDNIV